MEELFFCELHVGSFQKQLFGVCVDRFVNREALFRFERRRCFDNFHVRVVDLRLSAHLSYVAAVQAIQASDEEHEKADDTDGNDPPSQLSRLVLNDGSSHRHAVVIICRLGVRRIVVDLAF